MTEKDAKQLSEQEIEQVAGGDSGASGGWGPEDDCSGATVSWKRFVCPVCHGPVRLVRARALSNWDRPAEYTCPKCHKQWKKDQLVEE